MGEWVRGWASGQLRPTNPAPIVPPVRNANIIGRPAEWIRWLTAATVIGIALGVAGPFGSYGNDGIVMRVACWTGMLWIGTILLRLSVGPAVAYAPALGVSRNVAAAVATILACVPLAVAVALINRGLWPQYTSSLRPLDWYAQTLFVAGALVAAALWFEQIRNAQTAARASQAAPASAKPVQLAPQLLAQTLCLEMEDHYIRVHTAAGSELVLLPMRQAIEQLSKVDGPRVHRSWWVSRAAVRTIGRNGRAMVLELSNGLKVPVARNNVTSLRAAGWLAQFGADE